MCELNFYLKGILSITNIIDNTRFAIYVNFEYYLIFERESV